MTTISIPYDVYFKNLEFSLKSSQYKIGVISLYLFLDVWLCDVDTDMRICQLSDTSSSSSPQTSASICRDPGRGSWFSNLACAARAGPVSGEDWGATIMGGIQDLANIAYFYYSYYRTTAFPSVFIELRTTSKSLLFSEPDTILVLIKVSLKFWYFQYFQYS